MTREVRPGHVTAFGRAWAGLRQRYREGRAAIPPADRAAWLRLVGAGAMGLVALAIGLRIAAARLLAAGLLDWEGPFLEWLGRDGPLSFNAAIFVQTFGSDITLLVLVAATAMMAIRARRPIAALSILLAVVGTDLVVRFGWLIWDRARPDLLYEGIARPSFHSFPSGHAAKTVAVYGILALLWIRASRSRAERGAVALALLLIAGLVGLGRLAMGVHWPTDVMAGFLIGGSWAALLGAGLRYDSRL
jgi:undecaprenyl-diphosphatase